jgi:hypothetical protein
MNETPEQAIQKTQNLPMEWQQWQPQWIPEIPWM